MGALWLKNERGSMDALTGLLTDIPQKCLSPIYQSVIVYQVEKIAVGEFPRTP